MNQNQDNTPFVGDFNRRLMNNIVRLPLRIASGKDSTLYSVEGEAFLDFWGDEGVCALGYCSEEVRRAAALAGLGPHQLPDIYPNEIRFQAAELICQQAEMDRVFFANSGTEANEAAIKIARKYWHDKGEPSRLLVLTMAGNFHGRTGFSMAASDFRVSPYHRVGFGLPPPGFGVIDVNADGSGFALVALDGVECEPVPVPWDRVAAIIMAPVLGNNLVKTYGPEFWALLERTRAETGTLIVYDDVQAGSGRAGYYATHLNPLCGVKPDVMTLAKGIAMGYPMSAMLAREEVAASFTPGVHFNTFAGSPWVCAHAIEMIKWWLANGAAVRLKGEYIRNKLLDFAWVADVDGWGMLNAFTPDYEQLGCDGYQFIHAAREEGVLLVTHRAKGPIRFTPPLTVSRADLDLAFNKLNKAARKLRNLVNPLPEVL